RSPSADTEHQRRGGVRRSGKRVDQRHRHRNPATVDATRPTRPQIASGLRPQPGRPRPEPPARLPPRDQAWRELRLPDLPGETDYVFELPPAVRETPST